MICGKLNFCPLMVLVLRENLKVLCGLTEGLAIAGAVASAKGDSARVLSRFLRVDMSVCLGTEFF